MPKKKRKKRQRQQRDLDEGQCSFRIAGDQIDIRQRLRQQCQCSEGPDRGQEGPEQLLEEIPLNENHDPACAARSAFYLTT